MGVLIITILGLIFAYLCILEMEVIENLQVICLKSDKKTASKLLNEYDMIRKSNFLKRKFLLFKFNQKLKSF